MATATFSFEGGTNGSSLAAGSGAAAGDTAFDTVSLGSGATLAYSNTQSAHGNLSMKIATGATSTTAYAAYSSSTLGTNATIFIRAYCFFTGIPSVQHRVINMAGGGVSRGNVLATTGGKLIFTNSGGGTVLTSLAFPTAAWFRLEAMFTGSSTAGQWEYKIWYTPDSTGTPDDTQTSAATLNTGGTVDSYRFGIGTAVANAGPYWIDDVGASTDAYIGPATGISGTATLSGQGTMSATGTLTGLFSGGATLSGLGIMTGTGVRSTAHAGAATLSGQGTMLATGLLSGQHAGSAALSGLGIMSSGSTSFTFNAVPGQMIPGSVLPGAPPVHLGGQGALQANEQGPLRILLPGDVNIRAAPLALHLPLPVTTITAFNGTLGPLAIRLPVPAVHATGLERANQLHLTLPKPAAALTANLRHNLLKLTIPRPATGLTGARVHTGGLTVKLTRRAGGGHFLRPLETIRPGGVTADVSSPPVTAGVSGGQGSSGVT